MIRYLSDNDLFAAFKRGEEPAIRQVYHLFYKPLCLFALKFTGQKDEAEDMVTESFVKSLEKKDSLENLNNLRSFLYLVTKNACLNSIKAKGRHALAHDQIRFLDAQGAIEEDAVNREMLMANVFQQIFSEVESLPDRCREIFKMLFIEGLSTSEIGDRLGLSENTVRSQKGRAIRLIKSELLKKNLLPALFWFGLLFPAAEISA